jgi:N-acetylneuraminic acid mutarotase
MSLQNGTTHMKTIIDRLDTRLVLSLLSLAFLTGNTVAGVWRTNATTPGAHFSQTATLLTNGQVLVAGGFLGGFPIGEIFNPATGVWSLSAPPIARARGEHTATLLTNGLVLVAGGHGTNALSSTELFHPDANTWETNGPMNYARRSHTATLLPDGKVLVAGGSASNDALGAEMSSAEIYDPQTRIWNPTDSLANARMAHTATLLPNGQVLVTGGFQTNIVLASAELYDPDSGAWLPAGSMNFPRINHTATLLNNGKVLVAGGSSVIASTNKVLVTELYDPASGLWHTNAAMTFPRVGHTATLMPNGKILVVGGRALKTTEVYDPTQETWMQDADTIVARESHAASSLPDGRILIVGGLSPTGMFLVSTEVYVKTFPIELRNASILTNGAFQFEFTNATGVGFNVFASTNVSQPLSNWTALGSATAIAPGQFQFTDPMATNSPQRFYRVKSN